MIYFLPSGLIYKGDLLKKEEGAPVHYDSITRATSPWHSAHLPTSSKSPDFTAPVKLVMVTSWRHVPHHTLDSSSFLFSVEIRDHKAIAGFVKLGIDSMLMAPV